MSQKSTEMNVLKENMRKVSPISKKLYPAHKCPSLQTIDVARERREEIHFISQDLARKLLVSKRGPQQLKGLITEDKLEKLLKSASENIKESEEARREEKAKLRDKLLKEQEARRAEFEAWDLVRKKNEKLTELEEEAKQKMEYFREKANEAIREQNEEIKEINKLILSAKVQAIRDAQVKDKQNMKKEHLIHEANLDSIMEKERSQGVSKERDMQQKRKEAAFQAAAELQAQIQDNKERHLIDSERKVKEGEILLKKMKEDQERDYQQMKLKRLKKQKFLEELTKDNKELLKRKQNIKEQAEKEDKMIAEFQRLKALQDEVKYAKEKEAKKKKELELAKMGELYQKSSSLQAEQDALRARRAQEEKEREYRRKEKEDAIKKKERLESVKKSREKQIEQQQYLKRIKADAEIKELEALLQKLKDETKAEERKKLLKKLDNLKHLEDLKSQIRKKEIEKINERKEFFNEGIHLHQEEKRRAEMLKALKMEKLNELKKYEIPNSYINHIKRKVNLED
ncbi:cilia- and flagella-associated protein 45-like [Uloborus diversus]|uniref:cilia- and flagella-associated protein 45-like n=1 Tax=Uloborus diversus TaxID=327109 RepID=UPI0024093411|nr:cilia- and flagella-associated protein 45-like [Uloborus diversus]